jgi:hypothetical protein
MLPGPCGELAGIFPATGESAWTPFQSGDLAGGFRSRTTRERGIREHYERIGSLTARNGKAFLGVRGYKISIT